MASAVKIGSLTFCPECGNLLDLPTADDDIVLCNLCSFAYKTSGNEEEETKVVTTSSPHAFQSPLKAKRHLVQQSKQPTESAAMIKEKCPKCGNDEMAYHTMQLRSADEGQTVFYTCPKCGYKENINS